MQVEDTHAQVEQVEDTHIGEAVQLTLARAPASSALFAQPASGVPLFQHLGHS